MSFNFSSLGQGTKGNSPEILGSTINGSIVPVEKKTVRKVFPTTTKVNGQYLLSGNFAQTPFRLAMNAGDPNLMVKGGNKSTMAPTNGKVSQKVYDASDYIRFKRLQNKNRIYNDKSF